MSNSIFQIKLKNINFILKENLDPTGLPLIQSWLPYLIDRQMMANNDMNDEQTPDLPLDTQLSRLLSAQSNKTQFLYQSAD